MVREIERPEQSRQFSDQYPILPPEEVEGSSATPDGPAVEHSPASPAIVGRQADETPGTSADKHRTGPDPALDEWNRLRTQALQLEAPSEPHDRDL